MSNSQDHINKQLNNVFSDMQQLMEDRDAGIRQTEMVYAFDEKNAHSIASPCKFAVEGYTVTSLGHALTLLKAVYAKDEQALRAIGTAFNARAAMEVQINRFNANGWKSVETRCIKLAIALKYQQNSDLAHNLQMTGVKKLVYAGTDTFLSCGLVMKSDNIFYPQFWSGNNTLGKLLEVQRARL